MDDIQALAFDTGGTILDWHTGFVEAFQAAGKRHGIAHDWHDLANAVRRLSLQTVVNQGKDAPAKINMDRAHRMAVEAILQDAEIDCFTNDDINSIAYETPHKWRCWPDFPDVLPRLRRSFGVVSFTMLSYRHIIDTARCNGLAWDAVFSCEGLGKYKVLPEAYTMVAEYLQMQPSQILMVACHNFDLDAAKDVGFKTAFVRRPDEWGPEGPPDPDPNKHHDIVVNDFPGLAAALGV